MVSSMADESEDEFRQVRERWGITTFAEIEQKRRDSVRVAMSAAREVCPSGPVVYAAKLLGISRSRLRRLRDKLKIGNDSV